MSQTAKVFINGRSQAVRLPAAYRFETAEVYIRQDPDTGDVILSRRPEDWDDFLAAGAIAQNLAQIPGDFLSAAERKLAGNMPTPDRDPLDETFGQTEH